MPLKNSKIPFMKMTVYVENFYTYLLSHITKLTKF